MSSSFEESELTNLTQHAHYFMHRFPDAFAVLDVLGTHPLSKSRFLDPWTGIPSIRRFSNIGWHCIAVATATAIVGNNLKNFGVITEHQYNEAIRLALLHDAGKALEVLHRSHFPELGFGDAQVSHLRKFVASYYGPKYAKVISEAESITGHNSLTNVLEYKPKLGLKLKEIPFYLKLVRLMDDMTASPPPPKNRYHTSYFVPFKARAEICGFEERYPFLWEQGLVASKGSALSKVERIERTSPKRKKYFTYMQAHEATAELIAKDVLTSIEIDTLGSAQVFLAEYVRFVSESSEMEALG